MEEPEFSAASLAGKERYEGSKYLYREAELMRVRVKKEMLAMYRYREMQTETQKMREKNQQHEKVKNTSFDAIRSKLSADKPQKEANGRKSVNKKQAAKEEIKRTNTMGVIKPYKSK